MSLSQDLDPEWAAFVREQVASGRFADERDVITAALVQLKERETDFARMRAHVAEGVAEAEREEFADAFSMDALIAKTRQA